MFKKKANNTKKVDLCQQTQQITIETPKPNPPQSPTPNHSQPLLQDHNNAAKATVSKVKTKANLFTLQAFEKNQTSQAVKPNEENMQRQEQKLVNSQIEQCFSELRKLKEKEAIMEQQQQQKEEILHQEDREERLLVNEENINLNETYSQQQFLDVEVDEQGGFSPELGYGRVQDYDEAEGDYEDELIRKTLTKRNYQNLSNNGGVSLKRMKQNDANDSFIKKLKKVNADSIKKAISRDLYNKKLKLKELNEGLKELTAHGGNKRSEVELKQKRLKVLRQEMEKVSGVIEYIYYWGDRIKEMSMGGILKEMREEQARKSRYNEDQF